MASARAAGGGSLGSDTPANAWRAGAVVGGVARHHGAPEFRGLPSASPGAVFGADPRRAALTSEGGLGAPPRQDPCRVTGAELCAAWQHVR